MLRKLSRQIVQLQLAGSRSGSGTPALSQSSCLSVCGHVHFYIGSASGSTGSMCNNTRSPSFAPCTWTNKPFTTTTTIPNTSSYPTRLTGNVPIHPLQTLLNLSKLKTIRLLRNYPALEALGQADLESSFNFLVKEAGVSLDRLIRVPGLLTLSKETLRSKANEVMSCLKIQNFQSTLPFLQFPTSKLSRIQGVWEKELKTNSYGGKKISNRMDLLALKLNTETEQIGDMMIRAEGLITAPLEKILGKIELLTEHGILQEDIVKDPWVLLSGTNGIKRRLELCAQSKVYVVKPWMLRCTQMAFNGYVARLCTERQLLHGHEDIGSFLTEELGCSRITAREILLRVPSAKTATASKLHEMISFLYAQGYTRDHILEAPRILGHSVETIETRIKELDGLGFRAYSLFVLCYTSKHYGSFLRRLRNETNASGSGSQSAEE